MRFSVVPELGGVEEVGLSLCPEGGTGSQGEELGNADPEEVPGLDPPLEGSTEALR